MSRCHFRWSTPYAADEIHRCALPKGHPGTQHSEGIYTTAPATLRKDSMPTKRNPNDSTFRNITALKKRVAKLEAAVKQLKKAKT